MDIYKRKGSPVKAALIGFLAGRAFELAGLRETPKFAIVNFLAELRKGVLRVGEEMVARGELEQRDDLFFLHLWELDHLADGALPNATATDPRATTNVCSGETSPAHSAGVIERRNRLL